MSRAVTADHVLFDECIETFRRTQENRFNYDEGASFSYILSSFELNQDWDLGVCKVGSSIKVRLQGAYSAFISKVENPKWVGTHNSHLYGIALSSIVSFATLKPCKSTRDDYLCRRNELSESELLELALMYPILTAGPGCVQTSLSQNKQKLMGDEVSELIEKLISVDIKLYRLVMQSIRMIHLSMLVKKDDFGLAYLLVVSAIESIAQKAIKRDKVKIKHPSEKEWKLRSESDELFNSLLTEYLNARGKNEYLRERFIQFLKKFAPVSDWEKYVDHPMNDLSDYLSEISPAHNRGSMEKKHFFETYPDDLAPDVIEKIISDSYVHRSCFIHRGEQPPHKDPSPSLNRFFQDYREFDGHRMTETILPNYELLLGLAKHSIINWMNTK